MKKKKERKKGGKRERESRGEERSVREKGRGRSYIAITGLGLAAVHTPLRHHPAVSSPPPVAVVVTKGGERKRRTRGERERELARKLPPSKLGEARRRQLRRVSAAEPVVATATGSAKRERARETVAELPSPPRCWARHCPARAAAALPELLAAAVDGGNRLPSLCLLVSPNPASASLFVKFTFTVRIVAEVVCARLYGHHRVSLPPSKLPPKGFTTASSVLVFELELPFSTEYVTPLSLLCCHFIPLL
ncbi:uncharacterized protein DS421_15g515260 [Arachis hypogaea]|nr:uncharacterized protein DS421_15g515260 [Arachis hypogaea]